MLDAKAIVDIRQDRLNELSDARSEEVEGAMAELSEVVSESAIDLADIADAMAELSELVSELFIGGDE